MAPGNEVDSDRVVLFNFLKGHGQIKRSPIMVLNYNLIDYLRNSNLFNSYNPGQKVLVHLPFFMEFADNLQYTLSNTALTRFFPHPPWTKLRSLTVARYVKGVWLVTPNTVQGGGSTWNTFSSPKTKRPKSSNLLYCMQTSKDFEATNSQNLVRWKEVWRDEFTPHLWKNSTAKDSTFKCSIESWRLAWPCLTDVCHTTK